MHSLWRVFDKKGMTEMSKLSIPVGISNFEKIRNGGFYYIDKTGLIAELVRSSAEVTLITRPRRFGKTLGMSMLESFFDIRKDSKKLFDGLEISHQKNLCEKWMNQWPVVFLSLKNLNNNCLLPQRLTLLLLASFIENLISRSEYLNNALII